jgi:hypothetical protein
VLHRDQYVLGATGVSASFINQQAKRVLASPYRQVLADVASRLCGTQIAQMIKFNPSEAYF